MFVGMDIWKGNNDNILADEQDNANNVRLQNKQMAK